jgi:hypothetical protein
MAKSGTVVGKTCRVLFSLEIKVKFVASIMFNKRNLVLELNLP